MGALPKKKLSKGRKGRRRMHHVLTTPALSKCPTCKKMKLAHHACPNCGKYKGKEILEVK